MKIHSLIIAAALSVSSAWASSEEPMRFFFDKKTKSITASGQIVKGSHERLAAMFSNHPEADALILDSSSMGEGSAWTVLLMKEEVKKRKLKTISLTKCSSGCASIFNVGEWRRLGNLQIYTPEDTEMIEYQLAFERAAKHWAKK